MGSNICKINYKKIKCKNQVHKPLVPLTVSLEEKNSSERNLLFQRKISLGSMNRKMTAKEKSVFVALTRGITEKVYYSPTSNRVEISLINQKKKIGNIAAHISIAGLKKVAIISTANIFFKKYQNIGLFGQMLAELETVLKKQNVDYILVYAREGEKTYSLHGFTRGKIDLGCVRFSKSLK